jgi:pyruvate/2-oxoglutarate dehydrogenase complex dihydrolipoamide acyltransferase (E2) component
VMRVTLSCDHLIFFGAKGAGFLQAFITFFDFPAAMLL